MQQQRSILRLIGAVKCLQRKTGSQMLQRARLWHRRVSIRGFRMDSLCCVHAGELALPSKQTGAGEPSQRSDAEGRDGHIKKRTLVVSRSQRREGGWSNHSLGPVLSNEEVILHFSQFCIDTVNALVHTFSSSSFFFYHLVSLTEI